MAFLDSVEKRRKEHEQKLWKENNNLPLRHKHSKTKETRIDDIIANERLSPAIMS